MVPTTAFLPCAQDDAVRRDYQAWLHSARLADAIAEVEVLKAEAAAVLDKHLTKTADQVRRLQARQFCIAKCAGPAVTRCC